MLRSRKPTGFSIFELLVILAILAMVLGFLIPIIQKANEQAVQAKKTNNLKQVCLATHIYHDIYNKLPPAAGPGAEKKGDYSISIHLLPFVEQQPLWQKIMNDKKAPTDLKIGVYNLFEDPSTMDYVRVQNYAANVRVFTDEGVNTQWDKTVALKTSMPCSSVLFRTFTDGTSNTITFATRYAASEKISEGGKSTTPCGYYDLPLATNGGSFIGATPMTAKASATSKSGFQVMPTLSQVNCSSAIGMAHSFSKSGILIGMGDGSVRTLSTNVSSQTWNQALQPNDGNPPGSDF